LAGATQSVKFQLPLPPGRSFLDAPQILPKAICHVNVPTRISPEFAEVLGVHLGDGCLSRSSIPKSVRNQIAFTASSSEYWYYESFVKPTIESTFGVSGRLYLRNDNTTRYVINSKELLAYFTSLGIPVGKKRDASIPMEVLDQGLAVHCIRGVYHAEGSIYRRYSKPYNTHIRVYDNLLVIQIRTKLKTLMSQIRSELTKLGIRCNRLTNTDGVYTLRITAQGEITKFIQIVEPKFKLQPHAITL
jgi:hypothetical protein